jgi:HSP20 family molecular chaperone IbpA
MKDNFSFDLNRIMDEIFTVAADFKDAFKEGFDKNFNLGPDASKFHCNWDDNVDFYPAYSYPPANIYITEDKVMTFEFALSGFDEKSINLEFKGDYMILNAKIPDYNKEPENVKFFKHRLKFKDITDNRYYVPESKFDRENVKAVFKNGLLRVTISPKDDYKSQGGIKVNIVNEGN